MTIVHVMLRVLDFEASKGFYGALGLREMDRYSFPDFRVCYLADEAGMQIELIENVGRTQAYQVGDGFGNVAFAVPDAAATRNAMIGAGAQPGAIKEIYHGGRLFARYFHATDPDGYRVEILEQIGRWRNIPPTES